MEYLCLIFFCNAKGQPHNKDSLSLNNRTEPWDMRVLHGSPPSDSHKCWRRRTEDGILYGQSQNCGMWPGVLCKNLIRYSIWRHKEGRKPYVTTNGMCMQLHQNFHQLLQQTHHQRSKPSLAIIPTMAE